MLACGVGNRAERPILKAGAIRANRRATNRNPARGAVSDFGATAAADIAITGANHCSDRGSAWNQREGPPMAQRSHPGTGIRPPFPFLRLLRESRVLRMPSARFNTAF